jgi:hypothetical protein
MGSGPLAERAAEGMHRPRVQRILTGDAANAVGAE